MKPTKTQLMDPVFYSYEKCLVVGAGPLLCQCGDCNGPAASLPALTMASPGTGTVVCPACWHPVIGRLLWSIASVGGKVFIWRKKHAKYIAPAAMLVDLGLLKRRGNAYTITPAGLAILWLKESVGWEMEGAHARGAYRTESLLRGAKSAGYWSRDDTWGQWIHHHHGSASKVWPVGVRIGVFHFGTRAA